METKNEKTPGRYLGKVLLSLLIEYSTTFLGVVILAFLLLRFQLSQKDAGNFILGIYSLSALAGGFFLGKKTGSRKFFWGALSGGCYYLVLMIVSVISNQAFSASGTEIILTLLLVILTGAIGGMLA